MKFGRKPVNFTVAAHELWAHSPRAIENPGEC